MKKTLILTTILCLCAICGVQAQTVKNGTRWWDGKALYTATVDKDGDVTMKGITQVDGNKKFCLAKAETAGLYYLTKDNPDAEMPVNGTMGSKVMLVTEGSNTFLRVLNRKREVTHQLTLTTKTGVETWTVNSAREFINALGSNRTIILAEDANINLSDILEIEAAFKGYPNRMWCVQSSDYTGPKPLVISESESDGQQLVLVNFKNLTIKGAGHSSVEVDPRYAFVFRFVNCSNIVIENLTMGHTEGGFCSGGVIGANVASHLTVKNCDLYGCGTFGLDLWETYDFKLINSNIHDCTYGIMELHKCTLTAFEHCDFFNNREYTLIEGWGCNGVKFEDCRIFANWGDADLFNFDTLFVLNGCKIYHPKEHLGKLDNCKQTGAKTKFVDNPLDTSIEARKIGPDQQ